MLAVEKRALGEENPPTLTSTVDWAISLFDGEKYADAEVMSREELAVRKRELEKEHPNTLTSIISLSSSFLHEGKYTDALAIEREGLAVQKRAMGEDRPDKLTSGSNLTSLLFVHGQIAEAEVVLREMQQSNPVLQAQEVGSSQEVQQEETVAPFNCLPARFEFTSQRSFFAGGKCPGRRFEWFLRHIPAGPG